MKKLLLFLVALLGLGSSGAWAMDITWTSGVDFQTATSTGNATFGWFSIVTPFNGTISSLKINLGVGSNDRRDAYLGISSDLKTATSDLSASDFVAISTNTCGTSDYEVTMNFNNELAGGMTYYCYFLTKSDDTYTTVNQRYYVATGQTSGKMNFGSLGSTSASHSQWAAPVSCTMAITDGSYYRVKGNWPSDIVDCWIYSNSENEDKLWKIKLSDKGTPAVTEDRYVWKTIIDGGIKIQNVGSSRYIPVFTTASANGANVNYLSATSASDAVAFTPNDRVAYGKMGYVSLQTSYSSVDTWLNTYTNQNNYVGCHNSVHAGDIFLFQQVKKVTFSQEVAVNGGDAVSTIYVATDGSDSFTLPSAYLYSTDGGTTTMTNTEAVTAIAATGTEDVTVTVSNNPTRTVTYNLVWSDGTTIYTGNDVTANLSASASEFVPSAFVSDFTTLSYSPETINSETTEVTVTATWNGPFQISDSYASAQWQVVQMHTYNEGSYNYAAEKWSWTYKSDDNNKVKPNQVLDYSAVTTNRLFCFVGNPYDGFKIYNAAAGSDYTLSRSGENDELTMAAGENVFTLHKSSVNPDATAYFCLKPFGATNYVNFDYSNSKIAGWSEADNGSTCWVVAPGQYYLDFIDGLNLNAPVGAVGTNSYFVAQPAAVGTITSLRSTIASYMYNSELSSVNGQLDPIRNSETIALTDGYYQIVSANAAFVTQTGSRRRLMYNGSSIIWNNNLDANEVAGLFKLTTTGESNTYSIYSCNGQNFLSNGVGTLGNSANVVFNDLGAAVYTLSMPVSNNNNGYYCLHCAGHNSGNGTSGTLTTWDANAGASQWYIVKAEDVDITLNDGGDGSYYATMYMPFDVTLTGAEAYTLNLSENRTELDMSDPITAVPANTPVLLVGEAVSATASINTATSFDAIDEGVLTGTFANLDVDAETDYFLGTDGTKVGFYKWKGTTLKSNRAYLRAADLSQTQDVKGFALNWDTADGIALVTLESYLQQPVYNLAGQRVQKPSRGLYIINGKKVLVK